MAGRIVVFGATGYTGRLTARALLDQGALPVLAGRNVAELEALAETLPAVSPVEVLRADVDHPTEVRALVEPGDVLITTVGPFLRYGRAALDAALDAGAHYLDSTGEPRFVREVFESYGPKVAGRCVFVTACGYDFVPGNLAAALALDRVGDEATRVDVGYFVGGGGLSGALSPGTLESAAGVISGPAYTFHEEIVAERRPRVRDFEVGGRSRAGLSIGGSEHFALPALHPALAEVNVYLGWLGRATRPAAWLPRGRVTRKVAEIGLTRLANRARRRDRKATLTSRIVAIAYDAAGSPLTEIHLSGGDPYDFTAGMLAWGARQMIEGMNVTGAVGPVEAFGLAELEAGCATAGISRISG